MLEKLEKVKQAAKLCTECNGVACRKCPYDEHNNGGIGVPMCGVVFATDVLAVIDFMEQAMQAKDADLLATSDKLTQEIEQLRAKLEQETNTQPTAARQVSTHKYGAWKGGGT